MPLLRNVIGAACCLFALLMAHARAQTSAELSHDEAQSSNVLTYGMGYNAQRFSSLTQINTRNVNKLVPVWALALDNEYGEEGQPLVRDGVMFVSDAKWTVAIDAITGKQLWRTPVDFDPDTPRVVCCGVSSRGVALYDGLLLRGTLDAYMVALDQKTGKQVWKTKVVDWKDGYSITGAPMVANGVLIGGISGGDRGVRGFIDGYDPKTGQRIWRVYTTAAPGEKGGETWSVPDSYLHGGGGTWITGSYDPDLDLVYWSTGNAEPANPNYRRGDSLFTASVIALRPKTGEMIWYYQFTPSDMYDYDAIGELILADLKLGGKVRKTLLQLNKNGFAYVIDRTDGKLLAANMFGKVNWASRIDLATGRPVETDFRESMLAGKIEPLWPSLAGAKNWPHAAFSPNTALLYANTLNMSSTFELTDVKPGGAPTGVKNHQFGNEDGGPKGYVEAIDPLTGSAQWRVPLYDHPNASSMLVTASGLLFTGRESREFIALDAKTGKQLWEFTVSSGVNASPITWSYKGKQYVSVLSGIGGLGMRWMGEDRKNVPESGSVWTFALPN